jgi:hypothetical protein
VKSLACGMISTSTRVPDIVVPLQPHEIDTGGGQMRTLALGLSAALSTVLLGGLSSAQAQQPGKLFFEGDLVRGAQKGAPGPFCVLTGQYSRLEKVVWRLRILDQSGKSLDDKGLKSLVVQLPDGQSLPAKFGVHPPPSQGPADDHFWTAAWTIPAKYPTGTFSYKVVATDLAGNAQTWEPFKTKISLLTVLDAQIELKN